MRGSAEGEGAGLGDLAEKEKKEAEENGASLSRSRSFLFSRFLKALLAFFSSLANWGAACASAGRHSVPRHGAPACCRRVPCMLARSLSSCPRVSVSQDVELSRDVMASFSESSHAAASLHLLHARVAVNRYEHLLRCAAAPIAAVLRKEAPRVLPRCGRDAARGGAP